MDEVDLWSSPSKIDGVTVGSGRTRDPPSLSSGPFVTSRKPCNSCQLINPRGVNENVSIGERGRRETDGEVSDRERWGEW